MVSLFVAEMEKQEGRHVKAKVGSFGSRLISHIHYRCGDDWPGSEASELKGLEW